MTLKSNCTDRELSEAVAFTCAGWMRHPHEKKECYDDEGNHSYVSDVPPFATSADCVMPLLEKMLSWQARRVIAGVSFNVTYRGEQSTVNMLGHHYAYVLAPTFARAACFCLLKAAGVEVEEVTP